MEFSASTAIRAIIRARRRAVVFMHANPDEAADIIAALKVRYPALVSPPSDDICYASQNRQDAVRAIAAACDLVLVVGSRNSSNSNRLVEVARISGCEDRLRKGLGQTLIASVGPAVSDELKALGLRTDIYPADDAFFMRPLISAMATALAKNPLRTASTN